MSMTDSSKQYFQTHAGDWDALRSGYFQEAVRKAAILHAYLRQDMVVADIGAGTGFVAAGLAPLVKSVYVVDGSNEMLEIARRNLSMFNNIFYQAADGLAIDLPDASLDAVFANMYLHHCPDPAVAIQEMVRLLRPGGRLIITDSDAHSYEWMREEMADVWLGFDRNQIRSWYQQAGLVNVIADNTGETCCAEAEKAEIVDQKNRKASVTIFVAAGTKPLQGMKDAVAVEYRKHAVEGNKCGCSDSSSSDSQSCCCSSADSQGSTNSSILHENGVEKQSVDYSSQTLAEAPPEAVEMSLGCGNPLAIGQLKPGETVVDIGSGAGLDSFLAAKKVGPEGHVIGVDMTPEMIARARSSSEKAGLKQVEFRLGQAEALPVESNSVDVVISNCVINLCEDKGLVFQEAFRVLNERGRLEVSDIVADGSFPYLSKLDSQDWADCISGALPEKEYLDLIKQAGFMVKGTRRSEKSEQKGGVSVYSLIVSAEKPGNEPVRKSCCS